MMKNEIRNHVEQVILPFWKKLIDNENGGYYGFMDFDLNIDKNAVKGCILNSRILWFFSNAWLVLKDEDALDYAKHAYEFLKEKCIDKEYKGVFWSMTYDGLPEDDTKHTYNQAFAIYALASYYDASGDEQALKLAMELFETVEEMCRDEIGYMEAFNRKFEPISNEKLSENNVMAEKTMNTLLHVFEAYTELYRVSKNELVKSRVMWIMDTFADKVYNPEKHRQEVFFDKYMNSLIDLHSYGHDIETAWLIDRGVEILGEKKYEDKMYPITKDLTAEIFHHAFNGHSLPSEKEQENVAESFVWWVQAETVVGLLNGYEKDRSKKEYLTGAQNTWEYIKKYIWDHREGGEWYSEADGNNEPVKKPIVEPWKCPYHNGRMCFEVIKRNLDDGKGELA